MKMLQEVEEATKDRKLIKSQVEKRRRERINRSLERLRSMLLPEPQEMGGAQHRVEKAEILEHTVAFLHSVANADKAKGGGHGHKRTFHDGFSTCLQRAAHFLGPEGKGLWLGAALDASFAARFAASDSGAAEASVQHTRVILQMLRHKCERRAQAPGSGLMEALRPCQRPAQQGLAKGPQEPHRRNERVPGQTSKPSPSESHPVGQELWRPWP